MIEHSFKLVPGRKALAKFDRVIKNGMIVDGTRAPRYRGDIGIRDGVIAEIGHIDAADGAEVIDATG